MVSKVFVLTAACLCCLCLSRLSSKVEMGKWIEDLNVAIDMAKKSHEKSNIFLEPGLGDHSNRKAELALLVFLPVMLFLFFFPQQQKQQQQRTKIKLISYRFFFLDSRLNPFLQSTPFPTPIVPPPPPLHLSLPLGSSDEVSLEQESEDDMNSSRTSLDKQTHHRSNTTMHVCWHRNTSVSMSDHSLAVEVFTPLAPNPSSSSYQLWMKQRSRLITPASLPVSCHHSDLKVDLLWVTLKEPLTV